MKYSHTLLACLVLFSFVACETLLQANIKSLDASICIDDLKTHTNMVRSLVNDLSKKQYMRVIDKINDINTSFNKTIPKCADQFQWMNGQQRCEYTYDQPCEFINNLWYPKCKTGYKIKEQSICVQECPKDFKESGLLYCEKPDSYYRGLGYPWKFGDRLGTLDGPRQRCSKDNSQGCEQLGAIIYPKCLTNYHSSGCCNCKPDCPADMKDNGVTCMRKQYARGFGHTDGKCIAEAWSEFSSISSFGECADQLSQLETELKEILEKLSLDSDNTMWETLKKSYILIQHFNPFLEQCTEAVNSMPSATDENPDEPQANNNGWTAFFEIFFKILQWIVDFFFKKE